MNKLKWQIPTWPKKKEEDGLLQIMVHAHRHVHWHAVAPVGILHLGRKEARTIGLAWKLWKKGRGMAFFEKWFMIIGMSIGML